MSKGARKVCARLATSVAVDRGATGSRASAAGGSIAIVSRENSARVGIFRRRRCPRLNSALRERIFARTLTRISGVRGNLAAIARNRRDAGAAV